VIAAAIRKNGVLVPFGDRAAIRKEDEISFFIHESEMQAIAARLTEKGWLLTDQPDAGFFSTSMCHLTPAKNRENDISG
jgi:hypothetical protein